ncbi:MAG: serine hydrolase [Gemmatimonadaceae bacterium]
MTPPRTHRPRSAIARLAPVAAVAAVTAAGFLALVMPAHPAPAQTPTRTATRTPAARQAAARAVADTATTIRPRADYAAVVAALEPYIAWEVATKRLPALSIALVDDQQIVWARGFGTAREGVPATAQTIHRVGSVSKLFTDLGVMQLVERGALDLDTPVTHYLPDFKPANPFGNASKAVTLRQLMSHRAGLVREPPVGHYFDDTSPTLAATVASLNGTTLVYPPESRAKYSNAGIATVGYALERATGEAFAPYLARAVLAPMGLTRSAFEPTPALARDLAGAEMWSYGGRTFPAPAFSLGMAPAGSMYTSVVDLGKFLSVLFAGGRAGDTRVINRRTLEQMWTPQFAKPGERTGYGIGFALSQLEGRRRFGHGGAIYGFSTELEGLPDDRLGVVAVATADGANSVTDRIADVALRLMLAQRQKRPLMRIDTTAPIPAERARRLAGRYGAGEKALDLLEAEGRLYTMPVRGGFRAELRALADTLVMDDRLALGARYRAPGDSMLITGTDTLRRVTVAKPMAAPAEWTGLVGEYGWDYNTLYILERGGKLDALIEWFFQYPLERESADVYRFPDWGLYHGERLAFTRDASGRATAVRAAGIPFARRSVGPESGGQLKIEPQRPIADLRREALAAQPPAETGAFLPADLVELATLDSTIRLDIRYATTNNFLGTVFYSEARAFLQRPAAEALARAHRALRAQGYGLLIHDGYRPWYVTRMFWDATPAQHRWLVANPQSGSRHNRGAAVDLTLYELATGLPVEMPGTYDELSDRSLPLYPGGTSLQRWHRALLRSAMEAEGFAVNPQEWWHFDYKDWRRYALGNVPFDRIATAR